MEYGTVMDIPYVTAVRILKFHYQSKSAEKGMSTWGPIARSIKVLAHEMRIFDLNSG
jgi:hypothetical protein